MKNIIVLDGYTTTQNHLSWAPLEQLGRLTVYDRSSVVEARERVAEADIILTNKTRVDEDLLAAAPRLRFVSVLATGYNEIDLEATRRRGVTVSNVVGYSTEGVAQHVLASMLALENRVVGHHRSVQRGQWAASPDFCYTLSPVHELSGRTLGIYGYGKIGQRVGELARAFGMRVLAYRRHPEGETPQGVQYVDVPTLLRESDILTLHAPLNEDSRHFIRTEHLQQMKPSALLINTGRGGLIHEGDLRQALLAGGLRGAALDVLSEEPPVKGNCLMDAPNLLITPHMAWQSVQSRQRLIELSAQNVEAFLAGRPVNVVG